MSSYGHRRSPDKPLPSKMVGYALGEPLSFVGIRKEIYVLSQLEKDLRVHGAHQYGCVHGAQECYSDGEALLNRIPCQSRCAAFRNQKHDWFATSHEDE